MEALRLLIALSALVAAVVLLAFTGAQLTLALALFVLGIIVAAHVGLSRFWRSAGPTTQASSPPAPDEKLLEGLQGAAAIFISTPGVILGLLVAFGPKLTTTVKAAAVSLSLTIVLGLMLYGLVVFQFDVSPRRGSILGLLFNLLFVSLVFGVICIASALVSQ